MEKKVRPEVFLGVVADLILLEVSQAELKSRDGKGMQKLVLEYCMRLNDENGYRFEVRETKEQAFPDIMIDQTGVEVKSTIKNHWTTTGNSIQENLRDPDAETILFFFAKLGGTPKILIKKYEECLKSIVVTHSPRYLVDMSLQEGETIFAKMNTTYEDFRALANPMKEFKRHVKKELKPGETFWWLGDDETSPSIPVLRNYRALDQEVRFDFEVRSMGLCPQVFGKSPLKYERVPEILLTQFRAVIPNVRDCFSAGGKRQLIIGEREYTVRAIDEKLHKHAKDISHFLNSADSEMLMDFWGVDTIPQDRITFYSEILNSHTQTVVGEILVGDIFLTGL